ncbi:deleted in malignant brain tumors 1 protein-like [Lytechinus variegatus]|uniref:deleted in malignant brain tumors 1 protein-like n=1 Tax=Lytechinus variegatus TaxID=7654 RepID=UPI001BB0DA1D|nr:deleted in malignant brain tumors 1 protein-like [Lytechinus variegatus]
MLGFDGALEAPGSARFGRGSGRILLTLVGCDGTEDNLADCSHRGIEDWYYCGHERDAGVVCYSGGHPNPFQVRLIDGANDAEGRVEVLHDGSWGTICDNNWDLRDARVVCRMLGLDGALEAPGSARFGQGSGRVLLTFVNCEGTEDNLADCAHPGTGRYSYSCSQAEDAGAICYSGEHPNPFKVRLVGGSNDAEGRVEVLHDGSWGTICDDEWDLRDARVVCRMLEFGGALGAPGSARFGQGSGMILLDELSCIGTEDNIAECPHQGIGDHDCTHDEDAGAICYTGVRLTGGSTNVEGRVEVMHDGSWGTVCGINWDLRDARVVCRMMGYDGALEAPRSAQFGQGSGGVLLIYVNCEGTEDSLADCAHAGIGRHYSCSHSRDAGAVCYSGNPLQARLVDGTNDAEGRVEVMHNGSWGSICDVWWDLRDARVVCRKLGFDGALEAPRSARFGQGSGHVLLDYVNCEGTEDNLADCAHPGIERYSCSHSRDAGVICFSGGKPKPFQVRLTNGTGSEGRVEVSYKTSWGTVCDDNWDLRDARVVCNILGFDGALAAPGSATFGAGSGEILFDDVDCKGTEDTLADCFHRGLGVNKCNHGRDAGAVCFRGAPFLVQLVNGSNDFEGRVEVMYEGSWGTICDNGWDLRDARVVCKMLKFDGALAAPGSATFGRGSGDILLDDVSCESTHDNLADCYHRGIGVSNCQHEGDSGVICFKGGTRVL